MAMRNVMVHSLHLPARLPKGFSREVLGGCLDLWFRGGLGDNFILATQSCRPSLNARPEVRICSYFDVLLPAFQIFLTCSVPAEAVPDREPSMDKPELVEREEGFTRCGCPRHAFQEGPPYAPGGY